MTHADWCYDADSSSMVMRVNNNPLVQLTADFMSFTNLKQLNSSFNCNNRLLDLIFSNKNCTVVTCNDPLTAEDTHHKSLVLELHLETSLPLTQKLTNRKLFHRGDYDAIREELASINWGSKFSFSNNNSIDCIVRDLYDTINGIINKHIPTRKVINTTPYPPWYTIPLIKLGKVKRKYHTRWKRYRNRLDYQTYLKLRKREASLQNIEYHKYINLSEENIIKFPKLFWRFVKSKLPSSHIPEMVRLEERLANCGEDMCNLFN